MRAGTPSGRRALLRGGVVALVAAAGIAAALAFAACGRKGAPRPPEFVIPESPGPVRVKSTAEGLEVSWRRPRLYADGTDIEDLGAFDVYRSCAVGDPWEPVASLPVTDQERFRKGKTFSFLDRTAAPDAPCRYRVVAATVDGYRSAPAEGGLGDPEPTPEPTPAPEVSPPAVTASPGADLGTPGSEDREPLIPAPLVSPTAFPAPPW